MRKILTILFALMLMLSLFVGCSSDSAPNETNKKTETDNQVNTPDEPPQLTDEEKNIKADLEKYDNNYLQYPGEKIISVKIDKRQTDKDDGIDTVWCTVKTEDEWRACEKSVKVTYYLNDDADWVLDEAVVNDTSEWIITPLVGVSKDDIESDLISSGINVIADNEIWSVTQASIKNITVEKQETDLEAKNDFVTVTLTLDDLVMEASGNVDIRYKFIDGFWEITAISGNEAFTSAMKPGTNIAFNETMLINELDKEKFKYGASDSQNIEIDKSEISEFEVLGHTSSSKGILQKYLCHCKLNKPNAVFDLDIDIEYGYSESVGWNIKPISLKSICSSVKIAGKWTGTNFYGRACELNITDIDADGNITATYSDYGASNNKAYSYYVSGKIDFTTMKISLIPGDVIGEKPYSWFDPDNITATLYVNNSIIKGRADLGFTLSQ